ncbi:MAG TPA: OmpA family protein [Bacteroidia bacterium]|nr:OmpA family protein [Bacteroidia bacterium]
MKAQIIKTTNGKYYADGHGGQVYLPQGDISFADEVVAYHKGNPAPIKSACDSSQALGAPNFNGQPVGFVSLGCGGELILKFTDNALTDIPGPDLYVFEVGKFIEATEVYVSKDDKTWIDVGRIEGGKAEMDIGDYVNPGDFFYYLKLKDLKTQCGGNWPGADIDAVAAIGCAEKISLNTKLLFNINSAELTPFAIQQLDSVANKIDLYKKAAVTIQGFTDSTGTKLLNQTLSENRAKAVKDYLRNKVKNRKTKFVSRGYADLFPVADNKTSAGQEKNRRVEVLILPD